MVRASAPLTASAIVAALPRLTAAERATVAAVLRDLRPPEGAGEDHNAAFVYAAIVEHVTRRLGADRAPPYSIFRKRREGAAFADAAGLMLHFIDQHFRPDNGAERTKALRLLLDMLARYLERIGVPGGLIGMTRNLSRACDLVDVEFPGYRASGMLPRVLKAHTAPR